MSDITPVMFCFLIASLVMFGPPLLMDWLTKKYNKEKHLYKYKYLTSYSFTNVVKEVTSVCGHGNYFTNIDITDINSLKKLRTEIEQSNNVDRVVILNIISL